MAIRDGMVTEKVVVFGQPATLIGILTLPGDRHGKTALPAVIVLNAGILHRVGPNRIHVKLARRLAARGYHVLRFDFSGIGDSAARTDSLSPVSRAFGETREAMDAVRSRVAIDRFILFGICSGADIAFYTAARDERIAGAFMVNGSFLQSEDLRAVMPHIRTNTASRYYGRRLLSPKRWIRVITGKSDMRSIRNVLITKGKRFLSRNDRAPSREIDITEWQTLVSRGIASSIVFSEGSAGLDLFRFALEPHLAPFIASKAFTVDIVRDADHVFTMLWSQELLIDMCCRWLIDTKKPWCS